MGSYRLPLFLLFSSIVFAQNPEPTPKTKMYLGQDVDTSPYSSDESEIIRKIEAYKKQVMLYRQKYIEEGKAKPNKWDLKFVEDMKAKGEDIVLPSLIKEDKNNTIIQKSDADEEFQRLVEDRQNKIQKLKKRTKNKEDLTPVPTVTQTPAPSKEMSEEDKKYSKEKEEFLKKFKQKSN
jgi:hypothetical protein